jgi:hypothetical protein
MFIRKRSDTRIDTIEREYGVNLNARGDMLLGNLLEERGFDSLSQFLKAYHKQLTYHARARRIFLSYHAEDKAQVSGFRLMMQNPKLNLELFDEGLQVAIDSERSGYIKQVLSQKISRSSVVVCLIGNGTAWREWVDWELDTALELDKGLCGVRLKESRGRTPPLLKLSGAPIAGWDVEEIIAAIECAAARRS